MNILGKSVLVLGLGESGLAMARWVVREGGRVVVADSRSEPAGRAVLTEALPGVAVHCGGFPASLLDGIDLVALSPGLAPTALPQSALLADAAARHIPVWGEFEFFARKLAELKSSQAYDPHVLAITGTNGKTTVTRLTGLLCARAGLSVRVAGNISPAALDALADALDSEQLPDAWVLEASSFQLAGTHSFAPEAAVVLNVTQDHLDWHGSLEAYASAKARIFAPGTIAVLNRQDPLVMAMGQRAHAGVITFGLDAPGDADSFGVVEAGGMRWLAAVTADQAAASPSRRGRRKPVDPEPPLSRKLMPLEALRIVGDHNAANALAALALCHAIGLPLAPLLYALSEYRGEPHRLEPVRQLDGVDYYDDSKGTNVGATVAALEGLRRKIVLIAGGDGKGQDFSPLAGPAAAHARAVLLIGRDAPRLREALQGPCARADVPLIDCTSLEEAVHRAQQVARRGDAVLLSPACASLDMFRNYRHRAEVFVAAVKALGGSQAAGVGDSGGEGVAA